MPPSPKKSLYGGWNYDDDAIIELPALKSSQLQNFGVIFCFRHINKLEIF